MKKTFSLIMPLLLISLSSHASEYHIRHIANGIVAPKTINKEIGPDFWMYTGLPLAGKYPAFIIGTSSGRGSATFNFGKKPFEGDSLGYTAYDKNQDNSLFNGSFSIAGDIITPQLLNNARYLKSYDSGKYYFEAILTKPSGSDGFGFVKDQNGQSGYHNDFMAGIYASGRPYTKYLHGTDLSWSKNQVLKVGEVIQFWVDFDNGNLLIKKLDTQKEDHQTN